MSPSAPSSNLNAPNTTVLENIIEAPQPALGEPTDEVIERARALLGNLGVAEKEHVYPCGLSGGQQHRVAVMLDLAKDGMTMVVVTHEMSFAQEVADTVSSLTFSYPTEFSASRRRSCGSASPMKGSKQVRQTRQGNRS